MENNKEEKSKEIKKETKNAPKRKNKTNKVKDDKPTKIVLENKDTSETPSTTINMKSDSKEEIQIKATKKQNKKLKTDDKKEKEAKQEEQEKQEENDENSNEKEPTELIKSEDIKIDDSQLETIKKEIKNNKQRSAKQRDKKNKEILKNIIIGAVAVAFFGLLCLGEQNIPTIQFIKDLRTFTIAEMIATIVIFEIAYKKDSDTIALHGIEMLSISSMTLLVLGLYGRGSDKTGLLIAISVTIITLYYLIKSLVIGLKKTKNK